MQQFFFILFGSGFLLMTGCNNNNTLSSVNDNPQFAAESVIGADSSASIFPLMQQRIEKITFSLKQKVPVLFLDSLDNSRALAQIIAVNDIRFKENFFDKTGQAYRNEIFNIYNARPQ